MKNTVWNAIAAIEIVVISAMGSSAFFTVMEHAVTVATAAGVR